MKEIEPLVNEKGLRQIFPIFEVFFNRDAKLRSEIKGNLFGKLFELQKHTSLSDSFEFIAEVLSASRGDFYALPGLGHDLAVTVGTTKVKGIYRVDAIYVDGIDVLRPKDEEWATDNADERRYMPRTASELEEQLSQELVVPTRLLKITYTPATAVGGEFKMPVGYTVRKN